MPKGTIDDLIYSDCCIINMVSVVYLDESNVAPITIYYINECENSYSLNITLNWVLRTAESCTR